VSKSRWHRLYTAQVQAQPEVVFDLLSDMPNYRTWLPESKQFSNTTAVEPYPVRLGSRYHDGRPSPSDTDTTASAKDWWGTVTGFQRPGSLDFRHAIRVSKLATTIDVHIHYSIEPTLGGTKVDRWLVLDFSMPLLARPLRALAIATFEKENVRTMNALKTYVERHPTGNSEAAVTPD
jgi:hypothetical protein